MTLVAPVLTLATLIALFPYPPVRTQCNQCSTCTKKKTSPLPPADELVASWLMPIELVALSLHLPLLALEDLWGPKMWDPFKLLSLWLWPRQKGHVFIQSFKVAGSVMRNYSTWIESLQLVALPLAHSSNLLFITNTCSTSTILLVRTVSVLNQCCGRRKSREGDAEKRMTTSFRRLHPERMETRRNSTEDGAERSKILECLMTWTFKT